MTAKPLFLTHLLICSAAFAAKVPADFDKDRNGKLNGGEIGAWLFVSEEIPVADVDTDADGLISKKERDDWTNSPKIKFALENRLSPDGSLAFAAAQNVLNPMAKPKIDFIQPFTREINQVETHLQLRKSLADISYLGVPAKGEGKAKSVKDADPASFGFYRNNLDGQDTWTAEGVVAYPFSLIPDPTGTPAGPVNLAALSFIPSVEFNRVTGDGGGEFEQESDLLAFRAGFWADVHIHGGIVDSLLFSMNYRGTTNFGFDEDFMSAAELDIEPSRVRHPRLGVGFDDIALLEGLLKYRLRTVLHTEYGEQLLKGVRNDTFRSGPRLNLWLKFGDKFPGFLQRFQFFGRYDYLWTNAEHFDDAEYLEVGSRFPLDGNEQVLLEAKYRWGALPSKYTDVDLFSLSVAIKF